MKKRKDNRKLSSNPSDPVREPEGDRFEVYASRGRRLIASGPIALALVALVVIAIALIYR